MNTENCPCCPNHCSKDNLRCGRGKEYFGIEEREDRHQKMSEPNSISEHVIHDIRKCGRFLHHSKNLNIDNILSNLTEEELNQLHALLSKINID